MSTVFGGFPKVTKPLVVAISAAGFLTTACSTDVQRFGQTGGSAPPPNYQSTPATVASTPLQPLQPNAIQTGGAPQYTSTPSYAAAAPRQVVKPASAYVPRGTAGTIRVGTGDTLYSISRANGVRVEDLAAANGIPFPYHVRFGQTLNLPGTAPRTVAASPQVRNAIYQPAPTPAPVQQVARRVATPAAGQHVVEPKETLYSVSRRFNVYVKDLAAINNLPMTTGLQIGQRLTIPGPGYVRPVVQTAVGGPLTPAAQPKQVAKPQQVAKVVPMQPQSQVAVAKPAPAQNISQLTTPPRRASSQFRWPVRGRLISRFGPRSDGSRNDGVNISVPAGTSVKAAENGVVAYSGSELKGYGNLVLIRHSGDWVTAYAHNSEILVERGATVKRGQIIAKAGKTGSVSKPQVHFEVRKGAKAVDPLSYLEGA